MSRFMMLFVIVFTFLSSMHPASASVEEPPISITPDHVLVGLFYGGQKISIRTEVPRGYDVVVRVKGIEEDLHLKKKGKIWGILWMNVGELSFNLAPNLYMLKTSNAIKAIAPASELKQWEIGYEALKEKCAREPDAKELFPDLIKLKTKEGLFEMGEGQVRFEPKKTGVQEAACQFVLPPKAPVGEYTVDVFIFKDGVGSHLGARTFSIDRSPFILFLNSMVTNHGLIYGCIAVIIAILAGLLTGFIFGMGQGKGH
jgi:uncharacterized protein (TIGR02186 family)